MVIIKMLTILLFHLLTEIKCGLEIISPSEIKNKFRGKEMQL
jgi:hypothetical protein